MEWRKDEKGKLFCESKIKDVVYSIKESGEVFYVGLIRIPNKKNDFLSKITGRFGRELQIFVNGKPHYGSTIARCLSFEVAINFVSKFEEDLNEK